MDKLILKHVDKHLRNAEQKLIILREANPSLAYDIKQVEAAIFDAVVVLARYRRQQGE